MEPNVPYITVYQELETLTFFSDSTRLCMYSPTNTLFVVKRLPFSAMDTIAKLRMLDNPHLAKVYLAVPVGEAIDMLCEYTAGTSLAQMLSAPMKEERAAAVCADICDGLSALHEAGLVHRDINPNNIVITPEGNTKIIDFGIVRSFAESKSKDTVILGTQGYAAPEQFGFTQSDARTDIYAVGVLLNALLTGGSLPGEHLAAGPMADIIEKCTAIDPGKRYSSVLDVREAILHIGGSPFRRFVRHIPGIRSRNPWIIALAVFLYLFWGFFTFAVYIEVRLKNGSYVLTTISLLLLTVLPFCINHNVFGMRKKAVFRKPNGKTKLWAIVLVNVLLIYLGLCIFGVSIPS